MILLWLTLIVSSVPFLSSDSLHLEQIDNYNDHRRACSGGQFALSWLVQIRNLDSDKWYNGALISKRHLLTIKEAVTSIQDGVEKLTDPSRLNLTAVSDFYTHLFTPSAKRVLIAADYNEQKNETRLLDLVIVEVELPPIDCRSSSHCIQYICPYFDKPSPGESGLLLRYDPPWDGRNPRLRYTSFTDKCESCEDFIQVNTYNGQTGDLWVTGEISEIADEGDEKYLQYGRLHGLGINATSAVRLRHWEPFICEHTGVCIGNSIEGNEVRENITDKSRKSQHYLLDGKLILDPCTEDYRRHLMKESTLFNRLTSKEVEDVKENCGFGSLTSSVLIFSTTECPVERALTCKCTCSCPPCRAVTRTCEGTLITGRHVITSGDCLKRINKPGDVLRVAYVSEEDDSSISIVLEGRTDSNHVPYQAEINLGHRLMNVHRVAIPTGEGDKIKHGIALLELQENVKDNFSVDHGSTLPMCLSPSAPFLPETLEYFGMTFEPNFKKADFKYSSVFKEKYSMDYLQSAQFVNFFLDPVNVSAKCRQEECAQVEFDGQRAYGSSLSEVHDGRRYLHAVATLFNESRVDWAVRVSPYRTFICLHTGLCDEEEKYNEDEALLPYRVSGDGIVGGFIEELNEQRKAAKPAIQWDDVQKEMQKANASITRIRPLTEGEYGGQHCGGKTEVFEWPVAIGIIPEFGHDMQVVCTGAFISTRHVLTSRTCMLPHVNKTEHLVISYGHSYEMDNAQSDVSHVIYPDRNGSFRGHNVDIAVVQLAEDAKVSDPFMEFAVLCIPHEEGVLDSVMEWLVGVTNAAGNGEPRTFPIDMKVANITEGNDTTETVWDTLLSYLPLDIDLGSLWVRKNSSRHVNKDKVLYGVTTTSANISSESGHVLRPRYTKTQDVLELICRMSGVCPTTKSRHNPWVEKDIYVNGKRYCV